MTVVFFARLFYPHVGGVEKHVYNVSQELMKRGYKVILFTERYNSQLKKKDKYNGITIYRIPVTENWFKKFYIWYFIIKNRNIVNRTKIIHCHDVFYWYLPLKLFFPQKKVYTTFHGYEGNNIPSLKAKLMHKIAEKLSAGNICIGNFYKKWYDTNPTVVSYGAVNTVKDAQHFQLKTKKNYSAVFVGRLEKETGIMSYLLALNLLKRSKFKISLTILGDGSQKEMAETFTKKK